MQASVAVPCPDCHQNITTFAISVSPTDVITLRATCEPCKVITELQLTLDDLKELGAGRAVSLQPLNTHHEFVM
ncbi:MAG TPA: hypothetical protein VGF48_10295 [Thermoanaerobaculia bacterium]|jgi:hypothetical protein